jgi:hypothetical protein
MPYKKIAEITTKNAVQLFNIWRSDLQWKKYY